VICPMRAPARLFCSAIVAVLVALPAHGACTLPPAPAKMPDGATASEPEMISAMQTLKRYSADVDNYLKCLQFEVKQNRLSSEQQVQQHNATVDQLQALGAKFNEQVRIFRARVAAK
jgi:hypothetical protein